MTAPTAERALFCCDGAAVPDAWARQAWDVAVPIVSRGRDPALNLRVDGLPRELAGRLRGRALDLVQIAAYCYAADQLVPRRSNRIDVHRQHWRRHLALCIPVADPDFWADPDIHELLADVLGFLTYDAWRFAFDRDDEAARQLSLDLDERALREWPDSVVLVSGGTDSLCGLVEAVRLRGARPLLVSHWPAAPVAGRQLDLVARVRQRFPPWHFPHVRFRIHRRGSAAVDTAQRSRGFLFACLGAVVAGPVDLPLVMLAENGYAAVNPPISGQLVGAMASRGAHPAFVALFNRLLALVFPDGVAVANPLQGRTRAEALRVLAETGCADLLPHTSSCGKHRGRPREMPHCGGCSQCVDRRFSALAADLAAHDPVGRYRLDIFVDELHRGEPRTIAEAYVRFAQRVDSTAPDRLFDAVPELDACLNPDAEDSDAAAWELADLMRRHASEVLYVIDTQVERHRGALVRRVLPDQCLLRLAVGPGSLITRPLDDAEGAEANSALVAAGATGRDRPRHRWVRHGKHWFVEFGEEKAVVDHSVGMIRLARLLKAPGQKLQALDLVAGSGPGKQAGRARGDDAGAADSDGLRPSDPGALGERLDPTGMADLKARARQLEDDLAEAKAAGDERRRIEIRTELEAIAEAKQAATGKGGRPRLEADEHEQARSAVSHSVRKCYAAIKPEMPQLHEHLTRWVQLGTSCCYDPHLREHWDVTL